MYGSIYYGGGYYGQGNFLQAFHTWTIVAKPQTGQWRIVSKN